MNNGKAQAMLDDVLRSSFVMLRSVAAEVPVERTHEASSLITLLVQEIELQRIKMEKQGEPLSQDDMAVVGTTMRQIQSGSLGFMMMHISMQIGYWLAKNPDEVTSLIVMLDAALKEYRSKK